MSGPTTAFALGLLLAVTGLAGSGCKPNQPSPSAAPSAAASALLPVVASTRPTPTPPRPSPPFVIDAGRGLGPIRFGATQATVERLMSRPCDVVTPTRCQMISGGVEFELTAGVVSAINVYHADRPVEGSADRTYGMFSGGIPPDLRLGMVPDAIEEVLGKATKTETLDGSPPNLTVRRDHYPGLVLEYDVNPKNKRLILSRVHIEKTK